MTYKTDPWMGLCADRACIACGVNDGTVVAAHANEQKFGKGMGMKSGSWTCVPLCATHHSWLDSGPGSRDEKRAFWRDCWVMHMAALCEAGLVIPAGSKVRELRPQKLAKSLPRIKPHWGPPDQAA